MSRIRQDPKRVGSYYVVRRYNPIPANELNFDEYSVVVTGKFRLPPASNQAKNIARVELAGQFGGNAYYTIRNFYADMPVSSLEDNGNLPGELEVKVNSRSIPFSHDLII